MSWIELAAYLGTGVCAGLIAGLLGVGGGVVVVPALVWIFSGAGFAADWSFHLAVGTSLATLIGTGSASAYSHHRRGTVRWDLVRILAPWLVIGAWIGSAGAGLLDATWLRRIFGLFQLYVGLDMLFKRAQVGAHKLPSRPALGLIATGIGSLSALLGIAGGTLTVPFLTRSGLDIRRAVATAAACGPSIALAGVLGFMVVGWGHAGLPPGSTGFVYWPAVAGILLTSMPSAPIGARLAHTLPLPVLKRIFAVLVLIVAAKLLWG
ncbi:sulfite exporter TauE/SafE family protein [Candidatus Thiosymbion oneisti]|uniref:sulfite exporter TauE/SafE family protein n=1 Tax=Candidatus Thiosymbion oneisti TaxID=589554 RepID=UPI000A8B572A|nr:sulfite exporter TauE/SafE family protein [Candidatus Thiosymbion oneisti]